MSKDLILEASIIPQDSYFSLAECSHTTQSPEDFIIELISEHIIEPIQQDQKYYFTITHVNKIRTARSFSVDLGVNLEGIALALELLDRIQQLESS